MYQSPAKENMYGGDCLLGFSSASRSEIDGVLRQVARNLPSLYLSSALARLALRALTQSQAHFPLRDTSSVCPGIKFRNETSLLQTHLSSNDPGFGADIEQAIVVHMPPVDQFTVEIEVKGIRRAKPRIVEPDWVAD